MKIIGFALGIKVVKSFSIEDKLGAIIDEILYSENSEFNEKMFTEVRENHNVKILTDPSGNNKFTINPSDFVLEYNVKRDFELEFDKYLNCYSKLITKKIFTQFNIKNISRFGFVINAELDENDNLLNDVSVLIKNEYNDTTEKVENNTISLRFNLLTKKPLKIGSSVTEDFDNQIITYNKTDKLNPLVLSVDYQKYFKPELETINDATKTFETFCKDSLRLYKIKYCKNGEKK